MEFNFYSGQEGRMFSIEKSFPDQVIVSHKPIMFSTFSLILEDEKSKQGCWFRFLFVFVIEPHDG